MSAGRADIAPATLADVGRFVRHARRWLIWGTLAGLALGVAAGLVLPKKYRVDVVLAIVSPTDSKLGGAAGQLGGLASLVGFDLGNLTGASTPKGEAIEMLKSRGIARRFIEEQKLLPVIYPGEEPGTHSLEQAVTRFTQRYVKISENKGAGTINLSVLFRDRQRASDWAGGLVALADGELRSRAIVDAQRSIDYMKAEAQKTEIAEVRDAIYRLIDNNLRTMVVAKTRADFALRILDPPVPPDEKDFESPKRLVLALVGLLIGLVAATLAFIVLRGGTSANAASAAS